MGSSKLESQFSNDKNRSKILVPNHNSQVMEVGYLGEGAYFGQAVVFSWVQFLVGDTAVNAQQGTPLVAREMNTES